MPIPAHVWTPQAICPRALADDYPPCLVGTPSAKPRAALNVIVSAARDASTCDLPVFTAGKVACEDHYDDCVSAQHLSEHRVPDVGAGSTRSGAALEKFRRPTILASSAPVEQPAGARVLVEGGYHGSSAVVLYGAPRQMSSFSLLAPQLAGRGQIGDARMGLVMGKTFAPRDPLWGRLIDARRQRLLFPPRISFEPCSLDTAAGASAPPC